MKFITLIDPMGVLHCPECDDWHFNIMRTGGYVYVTCAACYETVGTFEVVDEKPSKPWPWYKGPLRALFAVTLIQFIAVGLARLFFPRIGDLAMWPRLLVVLGVEAASLILAALFYGQAKEDWQWR